MVKVKGIIKLIRSLNISKLIIISVILYNFISFPASVTAQSSPSIQFISPTSGLIGTAIFITGSGFLTASPGNNVHLGPYIIGSNLISNNGVNLIAIVPSGTAPGTYPLYVANSFGTSNSVSFTVTTPPVVSVTVTSPNGGEIWNLGSTQTISWFSVNAPSNYQVRINIIQTIQNIAFFTSLPPFFPLTGSYNWLVSLPPGINPGINAFRVRASLFDALGNLQAFDLSDQPFTIVSSNTPVLSSVSSSTINNNIDNTIQLSGANFQSGAVVLVNGTQYPPFWTSYGNWPAIDIFIPKCTLPGVYQVQVQNNPPGGQISNSLPITVFPRTTINMPGSVNIGSTLTMNLLNSCNPNKPYLLALSTGTSGIQLPVVPGSLPLVLLLSPDGLFTASITPPYLGLINSVGLLDSNGQAVVQLPIPFNPSLTGLNIKTAFVTFNPSSTHAIAVSDSYGFTIT